MKDIKGFEGRYAITEDGQIWSYPNNKKRKGSWMKWRGSGYANKIKVRKRRYKTIALSLDGVKTYFYIHRLVAQTYLENPNNLPMVNHKDGNPENNHISNLEWCTHKENIRHAFENGLTTRGQLNTQTKLSEKQVLEIRRLWDIGKLSQGDIAKQFNITQSNVSLIVRRINWAYL